MAYFEQRQVFFLINCLLGAHYTNLQDLAGYSLQIAYAYALCHRNNDAPLHDEILFQGVHGAPHDDRSDGLHAHCRDVLHGYCVRFRVHYLS